MNETAYDLHSRIVAHRGYPSRYPENTLIGLRAAAEAGARAVEFDVQCSSDGTPYVFHDDTLDRLTGLSGYIYQHGDRYIESLFAHYPERFGDSYRGNRVSSLSAVVQLLANYPAIDVFIEPKVHSLDHFGVDVVMDRILRDSQPLAGHRHIISFHHGALAYAREQGCHSIAWVVDDFSDASRQLAQQLQPEIVCTSQKIAPSQLPIWGDNDWMVYTADDVASIESLAQQGYRWIETDDIGGILDALEKAQEK